MPALVIAGAVALSGCQGAEPPRAAPTTVDAFPDPPHVSGPLTVELRPALALMTGDRRCRSDSGGGLLCSTDGSGGYRALGSSGPVVVDDVSTAPSDDHTSWATSVRFAVASRADVRRVRDQAAAIGGVVVVTVDGTIAMVAAPTETSPRRIARLGLQKAEAWSLVNAFK